MNVKYKTTKIKLKLGTPTVGKVKEGGRKMLWLETPTGEDGWMDGGKSLTHSGECGHSEPVLLHILLFIS